MKILISMLMIFVTSQLWSQGKLFLSGDQAASIQSSNPAYSIKGNISFYSSSIAVVNGQKFIPGTVYQLGIGTDQSVPLSLRINPISIYPNPTMGHVVVDSKWGQPQKVVLFTIDGRSIQELEIDKTRVDLTKIPSGTYILRIFSGTSWTSHRIVKE